MIASVGKEDLAVATGSKSRLLSCAHAAPADIRVSSVTYLFRTTGQVLGVSLSGALLQAILTAKLRERITGPDAYEVCVCPSATICIPAHFSDRASDHRKHSVSRPSFPPCPPVTSRHTSHVLTVWPFLSVFSAATRRT